MNMNLFAAYLVLMVTLVGSMQATCHIDIPTDSNGVTQGSSDQGPEETRGQSDSDQQN